MLFSYIVQFSLLESKDNFQPWVIGNKLIILTPYLVNMIIVLTG